MKEHIKNTCPVRMQGFTMTWSDNHLIIQSKDKSIRHELNPTAAAIWLMCDGKLNVNGIENILRRQYSYESASVENDLIQTLEALKTQQLIELIDYDVAFIHAFRQKFLRPVIRVGFCNFWDSFEPLDSYFFHMLAPNFDIMVVDPEKNDADLFFYTDYLENDFDHNKIDRTKCFKILVNNGKMPPDFSQCDYVFSDQDMDNKFSDRCSQVPLWIFYIDWSSYKKTEPRPGSEKMLEPYNPNIIFTHFYNALFSDIIPDKEKYEHSRIQLPLFNHDNLLSAYDPATDVPGEKKLTIGMAVYDEYDSVYFTLQAIRMYHSEALENAEILIVDNNPNGKYAKPLQNLLNRMAGDIGECRYIPHEYIKGPMVKDIIFRYAKGEYVLCIDSHVMLEQGAIQKLIDYLDANPDCNDLLQGPLLDDKLSKVSTHFNPVWSQQMYGQWGSDERGDNPNNEPFEILMQGTGVFACRKKAWLGFNHRFKGFGGEEGYIHEKYRKINRRTLCLPFLRWLHRFDRPDGVPFSISAEDRIRNYYLGFIELGLDTDPIEQHFCEIWGKEYFYRIKRKVWAELINPFTYFDAIYCITLDSQPSRWENIQKHFRRLGILYRIRRFSAIETSESESNHIGYALCHRNIIKHAQIQGLKNILVIEDDAIFVEDILKHLEKTINELKTKPWKIFHMGRHRIGTIFPKIPGCNFLQSPGKELTCTQSVAYSHLVYRTILDDLPDEIDGMQDWIVAYPSFDQYLRQFDERYLAFPVVTSGLKVL